jgi:hypothetical protein
MPNTIGPISGQECRLFYNTTLATTFATAGAVEVVDAIDVNLSTTFGTADVTSRVSQWKAKVLTLGELVLTFGYLWPGDSGDTLLTALRTAYLARTVWHWAVMDNAIATSVGPPAVPGPRGSQGITFPGVISQFVIDQPIEGTVKVDLQVELVRAKVSNALVPPAWLTVAAN